MGSVIQVKNLTKSYCNVKAVNDVTFSMESNKIYGLLGRNGAGKTTIMHMITAQLFATSGELKVFGEQPYENKQVLSKVCFIKEGQKYPPNYTIKNVLDVSSILFPNWDQQYAELLMGDFQLPLNQKIRKLSRGMLSSVGIIIGLASRAPLTIFDEPYLGLDAVARSLFYNRLIEDYAEYPRTIVLSTHLIDEVSKILEHVMVIEKGKLIINEDAELLRCRAFSVTGLAKKIEAFTREKNVINTTSLGGFHSAIVMGNLGAEERSLAENLELELTTVSLQQLIVYLTSGNSQGKVAGY